MHFIWHFLAWIIETILFLLTGGFLGDFIVGNTEFELILKGLGVGIIWKLLVFEILLLLLRFLILIIIWPLLNLVGRKISWKEITVMGYGGLRGAIGLSLAIYVKRLEIESDNIDQENLKFFKVITILYTAATIVWTVLLQGLTIKYVIKGIKFVE